MMMMIGSMGFVDFGPPLADKLTLLALVTPLVLLSYLLFLIRSKIVLNVEGDTDLLGGFALQHICNSFARQVQ